MHPFVQLTVNRMELFALDAAGGVWLYHAPASGRSEDTAYWTRISATRKEAV